MNYNVTPSEEKEIRSFSTDQLSDLTMKKETILQSMIIANNMHKEEYGDAFSATEEQIHGRLNQFISIVNDELVKRKSNDNQ